MTINTERSMMGRRVLGLGFLLLSAAMPVRAGDMPDPVATAKAFGAALKAGDEPAVKALIAPDVLIYEFGSQEGSRDEYAAHHLGEDMKFLAGAQVQVLDRRHGASGDLAWVATRSRVTGTYKDKPFDLLSTESLVLKRGAGGWRIVHVQWSSRPAEPRAKPPGG